MEAIDATGGAEGCMLEGGRRALVCVAEAAAGLTLGDILGRMTDAVGHPEGVDASSDSSNSSPCPSHRNSNNAHEGTGNGVPDCDDRQQEQVPGFQPMSFDVGDGYSLESAINDNDDRIFTDHAMSLAPPSTLTHPQEIEVEMDVLLHEDSGLAACCRHQLEVGC